MGGWCGILGRILTCFDSREGGEIMPKQLSTDSQRILKRNLKRFLEDSQGILKGFSKDSRISYRDSVEDSWWDSYGDS